MCFLIAMVLFAGAYNFYEKGFAIQALMSISLGLVILIFFTYRIIKNRKCFFGSDTDCKKRKKEE
ncbi:MAG: hypothetical protein U9N39_05490 [Campylobacterota bacterium]|nr:hypothetical protein [Campylobacterota bacterium]